MCVYGGVYVPVAVVLAHNGGHGALTTPGMCGKGGGGAVHVCVCFVSCV